MDYEAVQNPHQVDIYGGRRRAVGGEMSMSRIFQQSTQCKHEGMRFATARSRRFYGMNLQSVIRDGGRILLRLMGPLFRRSLRPHIETSTPWSMLMCIRATRRSSASRSANAEQNRGDSRRCHSSLASELLCRLLDIFAHFPLYATFIAQREQAVKTSVMLAASPNAHLTTPLL